MIAWHFPARRLRGLGFGIGAFARDRRGSTAIEFAFVAVPFFGLIGAILDTAYVSLQGVQLQKAVLGAGRELQTSSVSGSMSYATFAQNHICNRLSGMFTCSLLQVNLQTLTGGAYNSSTWSTAQTDAVASTFASSGYNGAQSISLPSSGNVVVLRVSYPVSQVISMLAGGVVQNGVITQVHDGGETPLNGGYARIIYGTYAFQVE